MNFVIVGNCNAWVCHTPIFGDDIICKRDIYVSIYTRKMFTEHVTTCDLAWKDSSLRQENFIKKGGGRNFGFKL